jgi:hypothetical protein
MTTPAGPAISLRDVFLAQPDAVVLADGSGTASCPLCGTAGAAVLFADPVWPEVVCTAGGPNCPPFEMLRRYTPKENDQ